MVLVGMPWCVIAPLIHEPFEADVRIKGLLAASVVGIKVYQQY